MWWKRKHGPQEVNPLETGISFLNYATTVFMAVLAPAFFLMGLKTFWTQYNRYTNWSRADAEVLEHIPAPTRKERNRVRLVLQYRDHKGQQQLATTQGHSPRGRQVGSTIPIFHHPENPNHVALNDPVENWLLPAIFLALGSWFLGMTVMTIRQLLYLRSRRPLATSSARRLVSGRLLKVKRNYLLSQRHKASWRLIVEYKDMVGRTFVTESEPIWKVSPETWTKPGIDVPIALDHGDTSRAWILVHDYHAACTRVSQPETPSTH
jgi:hypothetical protein